MKRLVLTTLSSIALAAIAYSQIAPSRPKAEKPLVETDIQSQRLHMQNDGEKAYFLFSDDVELNATNMHLTCDKLEVFANRRAENDKEIGELGVIREVIATGNVRIVQAERTATCQKAVVQPDQQRIVLSGNPIVEQETGRLVTFNPDDEIILDRGNGRIQVEAKGPRRIKLTSSAIRDLGFEKDLPIPEPEKKPEEEAEEGSDDEASEDSESQEPDNNTTEADQ